MMDVEMCGSLLGGLGGAEFAVRRPLDGRRVDGEAGLLELGRLDVLLDQFGRDADDVLALPVLDHVHRLQRRHDVALRDARHLTVGH